MALVDIQKYSKLKLPDGAYLVVCESYFNKDVLHVYKIDPRNMKHHMNTHELIQEYNSLYIKIPCFNMICTRAAAPFMKTALKYFCKTYICVYMNVVLHVY